MASSSTVPKHDFAPAWLKINGETQKPSGANGGDHCERLSRRDDRPSGRGPSSGRQRQSSCDQQRPSREGRDGRPHLPYRHHSIDVDESQYYNCGLGDYHIPGFRHHFGSQPSLNRRALTRQENPFFNYTAAYKGYSLYDFSNDCYRNPHHNWNQGRQRSFDRNASNMHNTSKDNSRDWKKENTADKFNQDFPSLKSDVNDINGASPVTVNGGVWGFTGSQTNSTNGSGSPKLIPHTISASKAGIQNSSNSIYRALIPSKGNINRKSSKESIKANGPLINKSSRQSSPTPPLEILNTRLVTHPKNLGNKKSDFLKTLRTDIESKAVSDENFTDTGSLATNEENGSSEDIKGEFIEEDRKTNDKDLQSCKVNGVDIKPNSDGEMTDKPLLSSSLEAEQRLLKEMGWKEEGSEDDDVYAPLTEDEMREFENISKKVIQQRNGVQRNLHLTWSPKRLGPYVNNVPPVDDSCSSSSDTESD